MSFQAYLDTIEDRTGLTPRQLVEIARDRGYQAPETRAATVVTWLEDDFGLGRGHAMALWHVIRNGASISGRHVGTTGSHRDPSDRLRLDGKASRRTAS